jgi:hypothetical protein
MDLLPISNGNDTLVNINNNSSTDVNVVSLGLAWDSAYNWATYLGITDFRMLEFLWDGVDLPNPRNDYTSPSSVTGLSLSLPSGQTGTWMSRFAMDDEGEGGQFTDLFGLTEENFGYVVLLDNECVLRHNEVPHDIPPPDCNSYEIGEFSVGGSDVSINITNGDAYATVLDQVIFDWDYASRYDAVVDARDEMAAANFVYGGQFIWGSSVQDPSNYDFDPPTDTDVDHPDTWAASSSRLFDAGTSYTWTANFANQWDSFSSDVIPSDFGVIFEFANECTLVVTATPRDDIPEPNCDLYSIQDFQLIDSGNRLRTYLTNNDQYSTELYRIQLDWDNAEMLSDYIIGPDNLYVDYFSWDWDWIWNQGGNGTGDRDSWTDTASDFPETWDGPGDFFAYRTYAFQTDFDFASGGEYTGALANWGLTPSDFGATFYFTNGCTLELVAEDRPLPTPTPDCNNIYTDRVRINGDDFEIRVRNYNVAPVNFIQSYVEWPGPATVPSPTTGEPYIDYLYHSGTYYRPNTYTSPQLVDEDTPESSLPMRFDGGSTYYWEADFGNGMPYGQYCAELTYQYDNGLICVVDGCAVIATPIPSATPDPNATPTPTRTDIPTNTPVPTRTPIPTSTNTLPPTNTWTPRPTSTPRPATDTPRPPSETNTPEPPEPTEVNNTPTNTPWPTLPGGG